MTRCLTVLHRLNLMPWWLNNVLKRLPVNATIVPSIPSWVLCRDIHTSTRWKGVDIPVHHHRHEELLKESYCQGISNVPLVGETIGRKLDTVTERYPDREAMIFVDDAKRVTYADFREEVDKLAAGLLGLGLQQGDRIGIWGPNCIEWVLTFYAAARAGLILVNINPAYQEKELEYTLKKVNCRALLLIPNFKTQNYYEILSNVTPELKSSMPGQLESANVPSLAHVIMTEGQAKSGTFSFQEILELGSIDDREKISHLQSVLQFDDPVNIQFTSGTTGMPKGATLSHHNLINNAYFVGNSLDLGRENTKLCIPVPLYHCFGMVLGCLASLIQGATAVYPCRGFNPGLTLQAIHKERCTVVYGTPTMFIDMLNHPQFESFDYSSLRTGIMAGSPCPIEVMKEIINKLNCTEMSIAYGLTETSPATNITARDDPVDLRVSTIGRPLPLVEVKVIDSDGKVVPVNVAGELCFRGHCNMIGYWDDIEKTDEVIDRNGWFHSGDLGVMDENKYCKVIGRLKDMIIRGGENVYPTEIEQFLYKHPKIEDVQVIGVPDQRLGEEICAWVKLKKDHEATDQEIKDFCRGKISHFKIPKYVKFVNEFPLTVTGKVKKFEMKLQMKEELQIK